MDFVEIFNTVYGWGYVLSEQRTIMKIVATSKSLFPSHCAEDHSEMEIVILK